MYLSTEEAINEISKVTGVKYSDEQRAVLEHEGGMCIMACAGSGKALPNDTRVLTPSGYKAISDLKVGDSLIGHSYDFEGLGQANNTTIQQIEGIYPQGTKDRYEVLFSDGVSESCCIEHLWTYTKDKPSESGAKWVTKELGELIEELECKSTRSIHIPNVEVVDYAKPSHRLGYLVGVLAYNTTQVRGTKVQVDRQLNGLDTQQIKQCLTGYEYELGTNANGNLTIDLKSEECMTRIERDLLDQLTDITNIQNRLQIMQGVIDTRGSYKDGLLTMSVDAKLVSVLRRIISSIGLIGIVTHSSQIGNTSIKIKLTESELRGIKTGKLEHSYKRYREIIAITHTKRQSEMSCIKVSNGNGLFYTDRYVVTHNTTILTHLIAKRCLTGEIGDVRKVLCTTYSKAGKNELGERLKGLLGGLMLDTSLEIRTIHATYYSILKHFGIKVGNICTEGKKAQLIDECLKELNIRLEEEDKETLNSILSYQVNNIMTDTDLMHSSAYTLEGLTEKQYREIRTMYVAKKVEENLTDFDDLQMYMYSLLVVQQNQVIKEYCQQSYEYIYVDEFQDTSQIQFQILREMVRDPRSIVVIGDDDQSIYGWRGADPTIILNVCGYFDIKQFTLTTNYRCCGEIVGLASKGIKQNKNRVTKEMRAYNKGGKLNLINTNRGLLGISQSAYSYIHQLIENGVDCRDIVVLCRNNRQVSILSNLLINNDIYYKANTDSMKFTKQPLYKDIKAILDIVEADNDIVAIKQVLWKLISYLGLKASNSLAGILDACSGGLKDLLWYILDNHTIAGRYVMCQHSTELKAPPKVVAQLQSIANSYLSKQQTQASLLGLYDALCITDESKRAIALLGLLEGGVSFMYTNPDKARLLSGVIEYIIQEITQKGLSETRTQLKRAESYDSTTNLFDDAIELCTLHGAKGREWKYVIMLADDNISFPNLNSIAQMQRQGVSISSIKDWLDEERRLHYVGFTRAKEELTIFANKGEISIFTLECLGYIAPDKDNNTMIIQASAYGVEEDLLEYGQQQYDLKRFQPYN